MYLRGQIMVWRRVATSLQTHHCPSCCSAQSLVVGWFCIVTYLANQRVDAHKERVALFITDNVAVRKGGCVVVPLQAVLRYSTYSLTMLKSYVERNPSEFPYFLVYHVIEAGQGHMQYGMWH